MTTPRADLLAETTGCCPGQAGDLLPARDADVLAEVFKALADPTRVRLLRHLCQSEAGTACACHLPTALGISQPTLSFHMRKLQDAGLVERQQRGRWAHWSVRSDALEPVRSFLEQIGATRSSCC